MTEPQFRFHMSCQASVRRGRTGVSSLVMHRGATLYRVERLGHAMSRFDITVCVNDRQIVAVKSSQPLGDLAHKLQPGDVVQVFFRNLVRRQTSGTVILGFWAPSMPLSSLDEELLIDELDDLE